MLYVHVLGFFIIVPERALVNRSRLPALSTRPPHPFSEYLEIEIYIALMWVSLGSTRLCRHSLNSSEFSYLYSPLWPLWMQDRKNTSSLDMIRS